VSGAIDFLDLFRNVEGDALLVSIISTFLLGKTAMDMRPRFLVGVSSTLASKMSSSSG
jgi:hypothetical protein